MSEQKPDYTKIAKDLSEVLGIPVKVVTWSDAFDPKLEFDLANGKPLADETKRKLEKFYSDLKENFKKDGKEIWVGEIFDLSNPNKQRLPSFVQVGTNGQGKNIPISEILKPYQEQLKKIVADAPTEAARQDAVANEYAEQLKKIVGSGIDVKVVTGQNGKQNLAINTRDLGVADKAIDELIKLRTKAGIQKTEMPFNSEEIGGQILIGLTDSTPSVLVRLESVKDDFSSVIKKAIADGAAIDKKTPSLIGNGLVIAGNFDYAGLNTPKRLDIVGADFSVIADKSKSGDLKEAALSFAKEFREIYQNAGIDISKSKEFAPASALDGNAGNLTNEEIASYVLARSMKLQEQTRCGKDLTAQFTNRVAQTDFTTKSGKDFNMSLEMARQILGDAYGIKGGVDTTTPQGNQLYLDAAQKAPSNGVTRGGCN